MTQEMKQLGGWSENLKELATKVYETTVKDIIFDCDDDDEDDWEDEIYNC